MREREIWGHLCGTAAAAGGRGPPQSIHSHTQSHRHADARYLPRLTEASVNRAPPPLNHRGRPFEVIALHTFALFLDL